MQNAKCRSSLRINCGRGPQAAPKQLDMPLNGLRTIAEPHLHGVNAVHVNDYE